MRTFKRVALVLSAMLTVNFLAWLWGFDYNERGIEAFLIAYVTVAAGTFSWLFSSEIK